VHLLVQILPLPLVRKISIQPYLQHRQTDPWDWLLQVERRRQPDKDKDNDEVKDKDGCQLPSRLLYAIVCNDISYPLTLAWLQAWYFSEYSVVRSPAPFPRRYEGAGTAMHNNKINILKK
jgi:hypothetical protein